MLLATVLLLGFVGSISGLECYSCEGRDTELCGLDPTRAGRVRCANNELCNVLRTERIGPNGVRSVTLSRGCRQSAFAGAVASGGGSMTTTSQSCSYDLCNTGDGTGANINFPGFASGSSSSSGSSNSNLGFNHAGNYYYNSAPGTQPHWLSLICLFTSALIYFHV